MSLGKPVDERLQVLDLARQRLRLVRCRWPWPHSWGHNTGWQRRGVHRIYLHGGWSPRWEHVPVGVLGKGCAEPVAGQRRAWGSWVPGLGRPHIRGACPGVITVYRVRGVLVLCFLVTRLLFFLLVSLTRLIPVLLLYAGGAPAAAASSAPSAPGSPTRPLRVIFWLLGWLRLWLGLLGWGLCCLGLGWCWLGLGCWLGLRGWLGLGCCLRGGYSLSTRWRSTLPLTWTYLLPAVTFTFTFTFTSTFTLAFTLTFAYTLTFTSTFTLAFTLTFTLPFTLTFTLPLSLTFSLTGEKLGVGVPGGALPPG